MDVVRPGWGNRLEEGFKYVLTSGTGLIPGRLRKRVVTATHYIQLASWMKTQGFGFTRFAWTRGQLFDALAEEVAEVQTLYLEFGVYRGESLRHWSRALRHPDSQLHGFDSFEGLPESGWNWQQGQFDTQGRLPQIDDARVHFHKGWFDDTLPGFSLPAHAQLVVNLDADLYSSQSACCAASRPGCGSAPCSTSTTCWRWTMSRARSRNSCAKAASCWNR